jgi:hypothetical protein
MTGGEEMKGLCVLAVSPTGIIQNRDCLEDVVSWADFS